MNKPGPVQVQASLKFQKTKFFKYAKFHLVYSNTRTPASRTSSQTFSEIRVNLHAKRQLEVTNFARIEDILVELFFLVEVYRENNLTKNHYSFRELYYEKKIWTM